MVQGLTAELEVYVSGFPEPTERHLTWYRPDGSEIMSSDQGVSFQDSGRRMILSNVQASQTGLYECDVLISASPYMGASTTIQLNVYGECEHVTVCIYHSLPGKCPDTYLFWRNHQRV